MPFGFWPLCVLMGVLVGLRLSGFRFAEWVPLSLEEEAAWLRFELGGD